MQIFCKFSSVFRQSSSARKIPSTAALSPAVERPKTPNPASPPPSRSLLHIIMTFLHVSPRLFAWPEERTVPLVAEPVRPPPNTQKMTFRPAAPSAPRKAVLLFQHGNGSLPSHILQKTPTHLRATPAADRKSPLLRYSIRNNGSALLRSHEKRAPAKRTGALPLFVLAASPQAPYPSSTKVCPRKKRRLRRPTCPAEPAKPGGGNMGARGRLSPPHVFPVFSAFRTSRLSRR